MKKILISLLFMMNTQARAVDVCQQPPFLKNNPEFRELREKLGILKEKILTDEIQQQQVACERQLLNEASWVLHTTGDIRNAKRLIKKLEKEVAKKPSEKKPDEQGKDGAWGCNTEWFWKLNSTYDQVALLQEKRMPAKYKLRFLNKIGSSKKLINYLESRLVSDPAKTGNNYRREFNESLSALMRLILRDFSNYVPWSKEENAKMQAALLDFLKNRVLNQETGFFSPVMKYQDKEKACPDISVTFHVTKFLQKTMSVSKEELNELILWSKITDTLIKIKNDDWPNGWMEDDHYWNHHNMDVVILFQLVWEHLDAKDSHKKQIVLEFQKMQDWFLKEWNQNGGWIPLSPDDDSIEEQTYWAVSFLDNIGCFDPKKRFWTNQKCPQADEMKAKFIQEIRKNLSNGGASGTYYAGCLDILEKTN